MSRKPVRPQQGFPERILVADISHPKEVDVELTVVSEKDDWDDLPVASYVREDLIVKYRTLSNKTNA